MLRNMPPFPLEFFANGTAEPGSAEPEKKKQKKIAGRRPANFVRVRYGRTMTKTKRLIDGPLKRPIDQTPKFSYIFYYEAYFLLRNEE